MRPTKRTLRIVALTCLLGMTAVPTLWAQPRPNVFNSGNMWSITFFNDPATNHQQWATQRICFSNYAVNGTHIQGYWYSITFPNWNGRYTQEGDLVRMHGDYANDVGHDHMAFDLSTMTPKDEAMGHWDEWREDGGLGRTIGWGNTKLVRLGCCAGWICPQITTPLTAPDKEVPQGMTEADALALSLSLPPRWNTDGTEAQDPFDPDQESVDEYLARTGQQ